MGKTLLSVAIAAIFAIPAFAQDIIILKNGTTVDAKVIEINENSVRYKDLANPDGPTYSVKKESVNEIRYKNGTKEKFQNINDLAPEKDPNSVWWTKARETKLGFWMDPLGFAQWGPMFGVVIRMGTNFDVKAHVRAYYKDFPLADANAFERGYYDNGIGFGLEFSKLFATTNGNWHVGLLFETAVLESYEEWEYYYDSHYRYLEAPHSALYTIATTGGYTWRFNNRFFIDFSLQMGACFEYSHYVDQLFYIDASLKLGMEL
jgi:hypothetical protein